MMEKHFGEWMKWIYEEADLRKQTEEMDTGPPVRKDGVGKVDDGEVG